MSRSLQSGWCLTRLSASTWPSRKSRLSRGRRTHFISWGAGVPQSGGRPWAREHPQILWVLPKTRVCIPPVGEGGGGHVSEHGRTQAHPGSQLLSPPRHGGSPRDWPHPWDMLPSSIHIVLDPAQDSPVDVLLRRHVQAVTRDQFQHLGMGTLRPEIWEGSGGPETPEGAWEGEYNGGPSVPMRRSQVGWGATVPVPKGLGPQVLGGVGRDVVRTGRGHRVKGGRLG